ncbi:hypothetical protein QOZ80_3BG0261750 [Eleusine coracana subsp. coracana]|nr:hypothetical protein QOZ80_3BG0261750 [Eleusine coracana subsp. coracana]
MFLRSKVQEMILKRRSKSMNGASAQQRSQASDQHQLACPSTIPCDNAGCKSAAAARALFASPPRLSHSSSLPTGTISGETPETTAAAFSMSPTSVLDAASSFASGSSDVVAGGGNKRRPWREGLHGLADALDCNDQRQEASPSLVRSCSLDRRVEFGVKNKSSWLPLCGGSGRESVAAATTTAAAAAEPGETADVVMEPSSEDYTCVICRGPNPRTVHIYGDRVVEGAAAETSPRPINLPAAARGEGAFLSL